jgi:serine/threonine protein phosphatase PrpC
MQALGANESDCRPDVHDYVLEDGHQLLLCTDGLTDLVDDASIEAILNKYRGSGGLSEPCGSRAKEWRP